MSDYKQNVEKTEWVFSWDNKVTLILAKCGIWEAQLARNVYSKGQIFVCPKTKQEKEVPNFLGENKKIDCQDKLMKLIADVSNAMVQALDCEKVYLVSMNESEDKPLHFWLIPRYGDKHENKSFIDHENFLNKQMEPLKKYCGEKYDGLNLLSALRNEFIESKCKNKWYHMPPTPDSSEYKSDKEWQANKKIWLKYAREYEGIYRCWIERDLAVAKKDDESNCKQKQERRFSQEQYNMLMQCSNEEKKKKEKDEERGLWRHEWQYKLLKVCATDDEGIKKWNEWREKNPDEDILLEGTNLYMYYLKGAYLGHGKVRAQGSELEFTGNVYLRGADLRRADLQNAELNDVDLRGARVGAANIKNINLCRAYLQRSNFEMARVDGDTLIWDCRIDRETYFHGVALANARVDARTRQCLEHNIRRMNWEDWYKEHWFWRWPFRLFWFLSDYGVSGKRVVGIFFLLALLFAAVYMSWAYWSPPGVVSNLIVQPEAGEAALHYFWRAVVRPVYFSIVTMTTLGFGDMYANKGSIAGHVILMLQVILGYVLLGALITRFAVLFTAGGPAGKFAGEKKR